MFVCYTMKLRAIKTVQSKDSFILRLYRFYSFRDYEEKSVNMIFYDKNER